MHLNLTSGGRDETRFLLQQLEGLTLEAFLPQYYRVFILHTTSRLTYKELLRHVHIFFLGVYKIFLTGTTSTIDMQYVANSFFFTIQC